MPARPCIIASAAYGSELAPEVQELRDFRDKVALSTVGGSQFMAAFNSFYYSFSPAVARVVLSSPDLAKAVRVVLYPLIWSLRAASSVYASFSGMPELGILLAGLAAGALIGLVYFGPSLFVMRCIARRKHTR